MVEAFLTRPGTDEILQAFVKSAGGICHKSLDSREIDKIRSKKWPSFDEEKLEHGWAKRPCVMFGILRGIDKIIKECDKRKHPYYYFDHAYIYKGQKHGYHPILDDRIYRIVKNAQSLTHIDELDDVDRARVKLLKEIAPVSIKEWKKDGGHILLVPPSLYMKRYYDLNVILPEFSVEGGKRIARKTDIQGTDKLKRLWIDFKKTNYDNDHFWEQDIVKELKKYTDREIRVRYKDNKNTFSQDLEGAWAIVSSQSTAAIDSLREGIPSFCESTSCALPMSLTDLSKIETPFYPDNREEWLDSLIANEYTLTEIGNGFAWNRLKNK